MSLFRTPVILDGLYIIGWLVFGLHSTTLQTRLVPECLRLLLVFLLLLLVTPFLSQARVASCVLKNRVWYLLRLVGESIVHLIVGCWCWIELLLLMMLLDGG